MIQGKIDFDLTCGSGVCCEENAIIPRLSFVLTFNCEVGQVKCVCDLHN